MSRELAVAQGGEGDELSKIEVNVNMFVCVMSVC